MYTYKAQVTRVVDGDTIDVDIDLGFGMVYKKQRVRMMGIDTPESRTRDLEEKFYGKESKYFLQDLIQSVEDEITLISHEKGKFGRILGEIFIEGEEKSVNQLMIDCHHAVPYYGASKDLTEEHHLANRKALNEQGIIYEK
jgi:micrococcal nuclease|tara:strand:- start:120 stop:542 length:423 start_codon:yes stop_codon:yes gene_type:complete